MASADDEYQEKHPHVLTGVWVAGDWILHTLKIKLEEAIFFSAAYSVQFQIRRMAPSCFALVDTIKKICHKEDLLLNNVAAFNLFLQPLHSCKPEWYESHNSLSKTLPCATPGDVISSH